jgi:single-strand DNA-binding protein
MSVNKVILVGRLGRDPEMRTTNSGLAIANIRLATTERRKDQDGNWGEHTEWHTVVAFGKTAESAGRFLTKGRQVYVEGRLRTRKWQDKDGRDRYSTEVTCDMLQFLGSKSDGDGSSQGQSQPRQQSRPQSQQRSQGGGYGGAPMDDDIPFSPVHDID